jgi:hypothetical protein
MFLLASPDEGRQLSEINLIDHALIKLSETGGMYTKALEKWNGRTPQDRKTWAQFRGVMVRQYRNVGQRCRHYYQPRGLGRSLQRHWTQQ